MTDPTPQPPVPADEPVKPDAIAAPSGVDQPVADPFAALGGGALGGGALGGGLDLGALLEQATQMQQHLADAQEEAASTELEGLAGGGVVKITATGDGTFTGVTIDPDAVDPKDVEMLQDLVLAALHDVAAQVQELQQDSLGGLDLGGLGGMLGGS